MNNEFAKSLEKKKLYLAPEVKALIPKEQKSAGEDLEDAKLSLAAERYKWATIQAYYALFHGVRTLLYLKGYKERSHYHAVVGIDHLFCQDGVLDKKWVQALKTAITMREAADYDDEHSKEGAEITLRHAEGFLKEVNRVIGGVVTNSVDSLDS